MTDAEKKLELMRTISQLEKYSVHDNTCVSKDNKYSRARVAGTNCTCGLVRTLEKLDKLQE